METTLFKKKKNSIAYSMRNEENGYPLLDPNKKMINVTKKPSDAHKKPSKGNLV
jgi:hypothetical protein